MTALLILAQDAPLDPTSGKGPEWGKAAPIALLIILLMGVALFVLIRSMNRQLKKVPSEFMQSGAAPVAAAGPIGTSAGSAEGPTLTDTAATDTAPTDAGLTDAAPQAETGPTTRS